MRILIVHNAYQQRGGEDEVVQQEASMLRAEGCDVHVEIASNDRIVGRWSQAETLLNTAYNPHARRAMVQTLRRICPDVVHVHNFFPRLSPSIFDAFVDVGAPCVMTLHNFRLLCPTATLHHRGRTEERSLARSCWWTVPARVYRGSLIGSLAVAAMVERHKRQGTWRDKVGRFIALSDFARDKFVEGDLPVERIVVKPNAVPFSAPPFGGSPRQGALFVGRLAEDKGVRQLIAAWRTMDVPLTIVGDGPLRGWAEQVAPSSVQFLGRASPAEVQRHMHQAALLIVPSLWHEMLPMTVLEAFASGLPVLASDTPSLRALLHQNGLEAGSLMPPGDPPALAAAVRDALSDPERLQVWSAAGRKLHARRYTPEINALRLLDIYQGVIAEGPRRASERPARRVHQHKGGVEARLSIAAS